MRRLLGVVLLWAVAGLHGANAQCASDTIRVDTLPGYTSLTGVLDPNATNGLNTILSNGTCATTNLAVQLIHTADTLRLSNPINGSRPGNPGRRLSLKTSRIGVPNTNITLTENSSSNTGLFLATTPVTLEYVSFARRFLNNANPSVTLNGANSIVRNCDFGTIDNSDYPVGSALDTGAALIKVADDSVLIERCLFRAPVASSSAVLGRTLAIFSGGASGKLEVRANLFVSTGMYLSKASLHLYANSFVGSRNSHSPVEFKPITPTPTEPKIWNNLFATKLDNRVPIFFENTIASPVNVSFFRNAYGSGTPNVSAFLATGSSTPVISGATDSNANVRMPLGFSNYADAISKKSYPISQMLTDPTLARSGATFGTLPEIFNNYPANTPSIASLAATSSHFYFDSEPFLPLFPQGQNWISAVKVGCFINLDVANNNLPSPLDTSLGSLAFLKATDTTKIKVSSFRLDSNYYGKRIPPATVFFAFADAISKLSTDDSAGLAAIATVTLVSRAYPFTDSVFSVPNSLRGGGTVYVKAVQKNTAGFAHVSTKAIATVVGIPRYPVNDLTIAYTGNDSDLSAGKINVRVTPGVEVIDSVKMIARNADNSSPLDSTTKPITNLPINISLDLSLKGNVNVQVYFTPIGKVGNSRALGNREALLSRTLAVNQNSSNTQYVSLDAVCNTQRGDQSNPWCNLDTAFKSMAKLGGQLIITRTANTPSFKNITIKSDTSKATITVRAEPFNGSYKEPRPVFRGDSSSPALIIKRKNVILKGLIFEMPSGSAQAAVRLDTTADSIRIDGNFFRASGNAIAKGSALQLRQMTGSVDVVNNIIWGFATGLFAENTPANKLRFVNNTLIEDATAFATGAAMTGFKTTATTFGATISSNFLSGVSTPLDSSILGKSPKLSNNVYTASSPNLQGLSEQGGLLDYVDKLPTKDLSGPKIQDSLNAFFNGSFGKLDCSGSRTCNSLLAGSSTLSDSIVAQDFLGKDRFGKHEVGAIELDTFDVSYGRGYLKIKALPASNDPTTVIATITSRNSDLTLADSVLVWYTDKSSTSPTSPDAKGHIAKPLDSLFGVGFTHSFRGLDGQKEYTFCAAFFNSSGSTRNTGYVYQSKLTTGVRQFHSGDTIDVAKNPGSEFPGVDAVFADTEGTFTAKLNFNEAISSGTICPPTVNGQLIHKTGFEFMLNSPRIRACIDNSNLGVNKSKLNWTLKIIFTDSKFLTAPITAEHLYAFPDQGLPKYVPSWDTLSNASGDVIGIEINGEWSGTYDYQFGHLNLTTKPGIVAAIALDTLDYRNLTGETSIPIKLNLQGSNFRTSNPLILATPIPAGSKFTDGSTIKSPLAKDYFSKTRVLSSGLSGLNDTLSEERFQVYFTKSALAESTQTKSDSLTVRPFSLPTGLSTKQLLDGTKLDSANLSIDANGALSSANFSLPLNAHAHEEDNGGGSASRSIEVVFTVFDGGKISASSTFIRTRFNDGMLITKHKVPPVVNGAGETAYTDHSARMWHLFSYPWDEDLGDEDSLNFLLGKISNGWNGADMLVYRYNGNEQKTAAYDVFKGVEASKWPYDSTRALWTATIKPYAPYCRSGLSLDYQPFNLSIPANKWTEFGLPFNFPIRWRDIVAASNPAPGDLFRFIPGEQKWRKVEPDSIIYPWQGLAIRPLANSVLVFPVVDANRSPKPLAKAAVNSVIWSASIQAKNASASMELRIGQSKRPSVYSQAPNAPGQNFRVDLNYQGVPVSEVILPESESSLRIWPLEMRATGEDAQDLQLVVHHQEGDIPLFLVEVGSQTVTPLLDGQPIMISAKAAASKEYRLAAGEDMLPEALGQGASIFFMKLANYPNPFQGVTRIRYDLPAQHRSVTYQIRMIDMLGKTIFSRMLSGANRLDFTWDGRSDRQEIVAPGRYHLTVEAKSATGVKFRADRDLIKL